MVSIMLKDKNEITWRFSHKLFAINKLQYSTELKNGLILKQTEGLTMKHVA